MTDGSGSVHSIVDAVVEFAGDLRGLQVLELFAGSGHLTLPLGARGTDFQDMLDELNASGNLGSVLTFALDSNGRLTATPISQFADYKVIVTADSTRRGSTQQSVSDLFGIGPSYGMDAAQNLGIVDNIADNPEFFALGRLDESAAAIAGTVAAVSTGDNQGAIALHEIATESRTFNASGNLAATTANFAEFSANVISDMANEGSIAEQFRDDRKAFSSAIEARITDISGVNMDEELSQMLIYQNAFSASARIITTADEMLDELLRVKR